MSNILQYFLLTLISLTSYNAFTGGGIANPYFLEKQKFLFEIVQHVQEPLLNEELIKCGQNGLERDPTLYLEFNKFMEDFEMKISLNLLLKCNEKFYMAHKESLKELKGLFYLLYNAKDWETLKQNICWARLYVHPQIFVFALTQAILKREDFAGLMLPKIYEIWPHHFFEDKYIRKLETFNYDQWNWEKFVYRNDSQALGNCNLRYWRCPGKTSGAIYEETPKSIKPLSDYRHLRNSSKWSEALKEVSLYYVSIDNNNEWKKDKHSLFNEGSYLSQDKEWHAYWYYINMGLWMHKDLKNIFSNELRDWWFWNLQQIVTRHKLVKAASIPKKSSHPSLIDFRGLNYKPMETKVKLNIKKWLQDLHYLTQTALNEQTFPGSNQTQLTLNFLPNLEEFRLQHFDIGNILNILMYSEKRQRSNLLLNFETMLRDDEFFVYAEILVKLYQSLKTTFDPYKNADFSNQGIKLNSVDVTELKTYFEYADSDLTNLMRPSHLYFHGRLLWFKSLMIRQRQLQHQPFTMWFNISSDQPQAVILRTFLQVQCDSEHSKCPPDELDYLHLDTFVSNLANGYNIIERHSKEFYSYAAPSLTYTELYHFTQLALDERFDFPLNITTGNCRFPHHLMLPRGMAVEGLPVKFVFVVTPYNYQFHKANDLNCDFTDGVIAFDDLAPGFPFDREVDEGELLRSDNVLMKNLKIYHSDEAKLKKEIKRK